MWNKFKIILVDWFKDPSNKHWDLVRPLVILAFIAIVGFQVWSLLLGQSFSAMEFGTGVAAFLALIALDRGVYAYGHRRPTPRGRVTHGE